MYTCISYWEQKVISYHNYLTNKTNSKNDKVFILNNKNLNVTKITLSHDAHVIFSLLN